MRKRLQPKLTINEAIVQQDSVGTVSPLDVPEVFRLSIANNSAARAEKCSASLLDIKPEEEWLPIEEDGKSAQWINDSLLYGDVPSPIPLSWSAHNGSSSVDIPPSGSFLLDVFCYNHATQKIILASPSIEVRERYLLPATDLVMSVQVDCADTAPIYCVCRYKLNPTLAELQNQCEILYFGTDRPDLKDYRSFKQTPRPEHWDR